MAQRLTQRLSAQDHTFAPEADDVFNVVDDRKIAEMREKLNTEYGIGQGRLVSLDDEKMAE